MGSTPRKIAVLDTFERANMLFLVYVTFKSNNHARAAAIFLSMVWA